MAKETREKELEEHAKFHEEMRVLKSKKAEIEANAYCAAELIRERRKD